VGEHHVGRAGVITISISNTTVMTRGIANGTQRDGASLPWPPSLISARLASKIAWYSAVNGGSWARPNGFV
jgi:hypothetical protein